MQEVIRRSVSSHRLCLIELCFIESGFRPWTSPAIEKRSNPFPCPLLCRSLPEWILLCRVHFSLLFALPFARRWTQSIGMRWLRFVWVFVWFQSLCGCRSAVLAWRCGGRNSLCFGLWLGERVNELSTFFCGWVSCCCWCTWRRYRGLEGLTERWLCYRTRWWCFRTVRWVLSSLYTQSRSISEQANCLRGCRGGVWVCRNIVQLFRSSFWWGKDSSRRDRRRTLGGLWKERQTFWAPLVTFSPLLLNWCDRLR